MNNINRNTRTLIVCFVVAIMALIPLRFMEVGQMSVGYSGYQVLGDVTQEIVLPNAEVVSDEAVLEAPYNEIESRAVLGETTGCIQPVDAEKTLSDLSALIETNTLERAQLDEVIGQMVVVENNTCR
jgi:hypothetical protein